MTPQQITDTFVIAVEDQYGLSAATPYTATITVNKISAVQISYSLFQTNEDDACAATKTEVGYLNAAESVNVNALQTGDSIFSSSDVNDTQYVIGSTNAQLRWVSVGQNINGSPVTRALEIDQAGEIVNIVECTVALGNAWPLIISYDEDVNDLCLGTAEYSGQTVYQNISVNATLADVVAAQGQIFTDEVIANTYLNNTAPANLTVNSGYYNDTASALANQYYEFQQGQWVDDGNGYIRTCPAEITYQTYSTQVYYNTVDRTRVDNVCLADADDLQATTLYFRANELDAPFGGTPESRLKYLMQNNIVIFTSLEGASTVDYDLTWPSTTFITADIDGQGIPSVPSDRKFVIWENFNSSGYTGNYLWKGVNTAGDTLQNGGINTELGSCSTQFERPSVITQPFCRGLEGDVCVPASTTSRENVFYALLSCVAGFENGAPYWNLYVIDGLHTSDINSSSYIKEFIDTATNNADGVIIPIQPTTISTSFGCMTVVNKVFAVNIDDAQDILNIAYSDLLTQGGYGQSDVRVVQVNPVDLGFTSGATINYGWSNCTECLMQDAQPNQFTLATIEDSEVINRSIPNFDLEKNYQLDNLSKPLLRTNPKISTNAKLLVNSNGKMYIEAIEASKELASVEYKKYPVNKDGQWSYDLHRFFKNTKTPADLIYKVKETYSNFAVQETFENQIEEDYHYGTVYNYSKIHSEDFRMLAPIWLDKNIPNKFVIFRVSDPVGTLDFDTRSSLDNIKELLKNSEIVKTFDLSRESELGTYVRNHIQSESFPKTPITMNFDQSQRSTFNGIDLSKGGFTSKGEYLDNDLIRQDSTLISANELITDGFQRNKLACANLINLEFLFNDDLANDYSVNRYFGLYVNDVDSGYGTLESADRGSLKFKSINSYINDDAKSAIPPFKLVSETPTLGYAATSDQFYKISSNTLYDTSLLELNVNDGSNQIPAEIRLAETGNSIDIEVNEKPGSDFVKVTLLDTPAVNDGFAIFPSKEQTYRLKFTRIVPQTTIGHEGWKFLITNPTDGAQLEFGPIYISDINSVSQYIKAKIGEEDPLTGEKLYPNLYENLDIQVESDRSVIIAEKRASLKPLQLDFLPWPTSPSNNSIVRIEELQIPYSIDNNTFFALDNIPAGGFGGVNFSNQGTLAQITSAIVKSINSIDNGFTALSTDGTDYFYIKTDVQGYRLLSAGIAVPNANANQWIQIDANNIDTNNLLRLDINEGSGNTINDSTIYFFSGGNQTGKSALVTLDSANAVNINDFYRDKSPRNL